MIKIFYVVCLAMLIAGCKTLYVSDTTLTGDSDILQLIAPYREQLEAQMNEVIGELDKDLIKESPESDIGNWLADMMYEESINLNNGVLDFATQNQGGVRVSGLTAGPITIGEIFEVMPFDNMLTVISATGAETQTFLDHIARGRGWPISKQLQFKIKDQKAIDVLINGAPLDPERTYHFAVPDYIAGGGSGSDMLRSMKQRDLGVLMRDAFIDHLKKDMANGIVQTAVKEGRIINLDNE